MSREAELRRMRETSAITDIPPELEAVASATRRRAAAQTSWESAVVAAHRAGRSLREIAAVAGVSNPTVLAVLRRSAS